MFFFLASFYLSVYSVNGENSWKFDNIKIVVNKLMSGQNNNNTNNYDCIDTQHIIPQLKFYTRPKPTYLNPPIR